MKHNRPRVLILLLVMSMLGKVSAQEPFLNDPRCRGVSGEYCGIIETHGLVPGGTFSVLVEPFTPAFAICSASTSNSPPRIIVKPDGIDVFIFFNGGSGAGWQCGPRRSFIIPGPPEAGSYRLRLYFIASDLPNQPFLASELVVDVAPPESVPSLNIVGQWAAVLGVLAIGLFFHGQHRARRGNRVYVK